MATMTRRGVHWASIAIAVTAVAALWAGCGARRETVEPTKAPRTVQLALDWFPNPDHAGIYTGIERGHFKDVGIKVRTRVPSDPSAPIKQVAAERVDLAISYEPEVLIARQKGLPVVAVAAIVHRPLTSIIALKGKGIRSPKDLRGKHVGTAGIPYQAAYLKTIVRKAGLKPSQVTQTDVGENLLLALLSGKVDAILGGFWNVEGIELKLRKRPANVIAVDRAGVPDYQELVLVANENVVKETPDWLHPFIAAMARGTEDARKKPGVAIRAIERANKDLDPKLVRRSVRATIPTLFPQRSGRPIGYMNPLAWERYGSWMADNGLLARRPEIAKALTNRFL